MVPSYFVWPDALSEPVVCTCRSNEHAHAGFLRPISFIIARRLFITGFYDGRLVFRRSRLRVVLLRGHGKAKPGHRRKSE